jgi:hypothetical protein
MIADIFSDLQCENPLCTIPDFTRLDTVNSSRLDSWLVKCRCGLVQIVKVSSHSTGVDFNAK